MNSKKEEWLKLIEDEHLIGNILFVDKKSDRLIRRNYDINYFPTFFLIDKNGKILNSKPPRPSDKEDLYKIIDDELNKN